MAETFYQNITFFIIILFILFFILIEIFFRKNIKKLKLEINKKYSQDFLEDIENIDILDQDLYIEYYKQKNILNLVRFLILFSWIVSLILFKIPWIFSFLAIALWAIIITFKELIISFFWFFYISTHYKIWENIAIWDLTNIIRWEIIYINILNVWIIWKNDNWEHNWQFYTIPNFKLIIESVRKEEVWLNKYKKEEIEIYFNNNLFSIKFELFLEKLKEFLDQELTRKNINTVWNYKTYIWTKYKLRFKYEKEYLIIKIFIIDKPRILIDIQRKLTVFVESNKKNID